MNKEVEYLKEHLYEIYKYKKSMKDLTYDMDIEHLLRTCKALDYSQKEIERLNNIINELEKWLDEEYQYYDKYGSAPTGCAMGQINRTKDKLQELKGSDKEWVKNN